MIGAKRRVKFCLCFLALLFNIGFLMAQDTPCNNEINCDDGICYTIDYFNGNTCECVHLGAQPNCDDGSDCTIDYFNNNTCECVNYSANGNCDDNNDCTVDSYDENTCECINTPIACDEDEFPEIVFDQNANWPEGIGYLDITQGEEFYTACNSPVFFDESFILAEDCKIANVTFRELLLDNGVCESDGYIQKLYCYWQVSNHCGNTSTLGFVMHVVDETAPFFQNPPSDLCGENAITIAELDAYEPNIGNVIDNCGSVEIEGPNIIGQVDCENDEITYEWIAHDECGNSSSHTQTICITDACDNRARPNACTLTQQFLGTKYNQHDNMFSVDYIKKALTDQNEQNDPIVLGRPGRSLTISDADCIIGMLPGPGPSHPLPGADLTTGSFCTKLNNNIASQTLTLIINSRLDPSILDIILSESCLTFPQNVLNDLDAYSANPSVSDLLNYAHDGLSGLVNIPLGYIATAVAQINQGYYLCNNPCEVDNRSDFEDVCVGGDALCNIKISPTVANSTTQITFVANESHEAILQVFSANGQLVIEQGVEVYEGLNHFELDVSPLIPSMYFARIQMRETMVNGKFFKGK